MTDTDQMSQDQHGPIDTLYTVMQERHEKVDASRVSPGVVQFDPTAPSEYHLRVSCCGAGPWRIVWDPDGAVFQLRGGLTPVLDLGALDDVETVADTIAGMLCEAAS
jgi:hypothetical protein